MRLSSLCATGYACSGVSRQDGGQQDVASAFNQANIPQDLFINFNPQGMLDVAYPQASGGIGTFRAGNQVPRSATQQPPLFAVRGITDPGPTDNGMLYTDGMNDDERTAPNNGGIGRNGGVGSNEGMNNGGVGNSGGMGRGSGVGNSGGMNNGGIGNNGGMNNNNGMREQQLVSQTAPITDYLQPSPPSGSDAHRYIFLLFRQPDGFNDQRIVTPSTSRLSFNISAFADAVGLGDPLAGTFMLVAPDS